MNQFFEDLMKFYGKQSAAAKAIQISPQLMSKYLRQKKCPLEIAVQWEALTNGAVKAPLPDYFRKQA